MKKKLSPEFWVSTLVLAAILAGFVVWTESGKASGSEDYGFTVHRAKQVR